MKPLAIDLYCGLGGWAEGFLAEGYTVIGFDIERHDYGTGGYPGQLVLQDVTTLHGSQFKNAVIIVASPPCQAYSYRAMPWKRAKALPPPDNTLFETCFRIQREACEAGGRYIPLIVENVRGAQKWVGRSAWNFGSFHLWGDVPALMPIPLSVRKVPGFRFDGSGKSFQSESVKVTAHLNIRNGHSHTRHLTNPAEHSGIKNPGMPLSEAGFNVTVARNVDGHLKPASYVRDEEMKRQHLGFKRKAASAMIAKIPFPLARHIAQVFKGVPVLA